MIPFSALKSSVECRMAEDGGRLNADHDWLCVHFGGGVWRDLARRLHCYSASVGRTDRQSQNRILENKITNTLETSRGILEVGEGQDMT